MANAPTPDEQYVANYLLARAELERLQAEARRRAQDARLTEEERIAAELAVLELAEQIAELDAAHNLLRQRHQPGVNPPSDATVQESLRLATALADVIAAAATLDAALDAVVGLVDAWGKL